jgi:hypothetical protein
MSPDDTNRAKLARLADAIIEDIMATPDADIVAEVGHASIERARTIILEVKRNLSRRALAEAKAQLEAWRSARSRAGNTLDRHRIPWKSTVTAERYLQNAVKESMTINPVPLGTRACSNVLHPAG